MKKYVFVILFFFFFSSNNVFADDQTKLNEIRSHIGFANPLPTFVGNSVSHAGDINNDGHDDYAYWVISRYNNTNEIEIRSGKNGSLLHKKSSESHYDWGPNFSAVGDINKDGFGDFIISSPLASTVKGSNSGKIEVFSGKDGQRLYSFNGDGPDNHFGRSVDGLGDIDKDGYPDFIASSQTHKPTSNSGSAFFLRDYIKVFSGKTGKVIFKIYDHHKAYSVVYKSGFGTSVSSAGDVNNDSYNDFIVGAPKQSKATIYSGKNGSIIYDFHFPVLNVKFGYSVNELGDVDQDGYDDVIIGAPSDTGVGFFGGAYVYSGRAGSAIFTLVGNADYSFGKSVAGLGDANLDGYPDFIVGEEKYMTPPYSYDEGAVYIYSGKDGNLIKKIVGESPSLSGFAVDRAGDVNADGYPDIIFSAPNYIDRGQSNGGWPVGKVSIQTLNPYCDAGIGLSGTGGQTPYLKATGYPAVGEKIRLKLTDGLPGATATIIFGRQNLSIPYKGGTLVPSNGHQEIRILNNVTGSLETEIPIPNLFVPGDNLFFQVVIDDPGAIQGVSMSNALHVMIK